MNPAQAKVKIMHAVERFAREMGATWESADNWASVSEMVVDLIVRVGDLIDKEDVALLMTAAALAHRQSRPDAYRNHQGGKHVG